MGMWPSNMGEGTNKKRLTQPSRRKNSTNCESTGLSSNNSGFHNQVQGSTKQKIEFYHFRKNMNSATRTQQQELVISTENIVMAPENRPCHGKSSYVFVCMGIALSIFDSPPKKCWLWFYDLKNNRIELPSNNSSRSHLSIRTQRHRLLNEWLLPGVRVEAIPWEIVGKKRVSMRITMVMTNRSWEITPVSFTVLNHIHL